MRRKHQFLAGLSGACLMLALPVICRAATITVNSLADPNPSPGTTTFCVLRDAITAANTGAAVNGCTAGTGNDTIVFSLTGTITIGSTLPAIANTLTIQGPTVTPPAIAISNDDKFFNPWLGVDSKATLNLNSVTISDISVLDNSGTLTVTESEFTGTGTGAISSEGSLTVSNSTFSGNSCSAGCYTIESSSPQTVTLTNSTIEHNGGSLGGGAIDADSLVVTNCTFTGNNAFFGGGAIVADTLTVTNSTFDDNSAFCFPENCSPTSLGGAIEASSLTVTNSTFVDNNAGWGGAIEANSATVTNSTFVGNSATGVTFGFPSARAGLGGAIFSQGSTAVTNSTFSANSAEVDGGGGIFNSQGTLTVTNSTFNGNTSGGIANGIALSLDSSLGTVDVKGAILTASTDGNCVGPITDDGYNLDDDGSCGFASGTTPDSAIALDPAGLQDNGGPTQTIALESTSVAINKIPVPNCTDQSTPPVRLATDQRGVIRPQFTACDIGAYEYDTALSLKTNVLSAIDAATGGSGKDQQTLKLAAGSLYQALLLLTGGDGNSVSPALGGLEFQTEQTAVQLLAGLTPSSALSSTTLDTWLLNITIADRTLAVVAISNAGGDTGASQLVATGDAQAAGGNYLAAVVSYRKAWSLVQS